MEKLCLQNYILWLRIFFTIFAIKMKTKKCTRCKCVKDVNEFYDKSSNSDGKNKTCNKCLNYYSKDHYLHNREAYLVNIKNRKQYLREFILRIKKRASCPLCGEKRYWVLEFHHLDKNDKEYNIARMPSYGYSIKKIKEELRKCIILCANCHKDLHHGISAEGDRGLTVNQVSVD